MVDIAVSTIRVISKKGSATRTVRATSATSWFDRQGTLQSLGVTHGSAGFRGDYSHALVRRCPPISDSYAGWTRRAVADLSQRQMGNHNAEGLAHDYTTLRLGFGGWWLRARFYRDEFRNPASWKRAPWDYRGIWVLSPAGEVLQEPDPGVLAPGFYHSPNRRGSLSFGRASCGVAATAINLVPEVEEGTGPTSALTTVRQPNPRFF